VAQRSQQLQQLLDSRGRTLIERRGVKPARLADDAYHLLRTASWWRILALLAVAFLISNLVFAAILYFGHADVANAHGFLDQFWFSVQTMGTIGYGVLAPNDHLANVIVTIESFYSIVFTALVTGIVFSRFSTPSARVMFSRVALISWHDGQRALLFRMANERTTAIVEATIKVYMTRDERLSNGEPMRRVYDIPLRRATSPVFALSFLAVHIIDDKSPLYKVGAPSLRESNANIVVTFTGIDDQLAATVHSRYLWTWNEVVYDHKYADLFKVDTTTGKRYLDLGPLHDTEPMDEPVTSEADPDSLE
jgi:inward rectifier potassium channel